jgi:hypothetical protein
MCRAGIFLRNLFQNTSSAHRARRGLRCRIVRRITILFAPQIVTGGGKCLSPLARHAIATYRRHSLGLLWWSQLVVALYEQVLRDSGTHRGTQVHTQTENIHRFLMVTEVSLLRATSLLLIFLTLLPPQCVASL